MSRSQLIENLDSVHIKRVRALYLKKNRQKYSRVIAEGVNASEVLVNKHPEAVVEILVEDLPKDDAPSTSKWRKRLNQLVQNAHAKNLVVHYVTPRVMKSISENAEGVICIAKTIIFDDAYTSTGTESYRPKDIVVVCKETSDPGNAGMLIRACVAFGVSKVIFAGDSVDHWNPKVVRASVGAVFQIAIQNAPDVKTALQYLRSSGYSIVAADGIGTEKTCPHDLSRSQVLLESNSIAWLFGNEAHGLDESELDLADEILKVEMLPNAVESLNLAGALHICLYETFVHE